MNKKEITEIKKNFTSDNGYFTTDSILTAFIDAEKNIVYKDVHSTYTMTVEDRDIYDETLLKVLSTNIGKNINEFEFPNGAYEEDKAQKILYHLVKGELKDDNANEAFLNHVVSNFVYSGPYTIISAYCTYNVRQFSNDDEYNDDMDELYRFIITAICPADTGDDGFVFDSDNKEVIKKLNTELIISKAPSDGFIFPVFDNRSSDINHVMVYTKSKAKPNISMVENVMQCNYTMSADLEKSNFQNLLKTVVDEDLNYSFINSVNDKIKDMINQNRDDTDVTTINAETIADICSDFGLSEERVDMIAPVYEKLCGDMELTAYNVIDNKTTINTEGIKISVGSADTDKIRTAVIDGRKCIIIDVDEPTIEVNGLPVNL